MRDTSWKLKSRNKQINKKIQFLLGYHVYFTFTLSNIEWFYVWECLGTLISLSPVLHEGSEELKDPEHLLATWWRTICITIKQKPVQGKEQHQETYKSWVKTDTESKRDLCDGKKIWRRTLTTVAKMKPRENGMKILKIN